MSANPKNIALEPAAQAFVEATADPPYLFQLPVAEGRAAVDGWRDTRGSRPTVRISDSVMATGWGHAALQETGRKHQSTTKVRQRVQTRSLGTCRQRAGASY